MQSHYRQLPKPCNLHVSTHHFLKELCRLISWLTSSSSKCINSITDHFLQEMCHTTWLPTTSNKTYQFPVGYYWQNDSLSWCMSWNLSQTLVQWGRSSGNDGVTRRVASSAVLDSHNICQPSSAPSGCWLSGRSLNVSSEIIPWNGQLWRIWEHLLWSFIVLVMRIKF